MKAATFSSSLMWFSRKTTAFAAAAVFCVIFSLVMLHQYSESLPQITWRPYTAPQNGWGIDLDTPVCAESRDIVSEDIWAESRRKYQHLRDDKFTLVISTYKRPDSLNATLSLVLSEEIPTLHEVVIVWNEVNTTAPADFISDYNVRVRFRVSPRNSLNMKLWADPEIRTQAILLSDDDCHYEPDDMGFIFNYWKEHAQDRIVGAFPRSYTIGEDGQYKYSFARGWDRYSMILTGLAFAHISFLDYYSSDDPLMTDIRNLIDEKFNCEDIALNYIVSMLTCNSPLQVVGLKHPINAGGKHGISTKKGHIGKRHSCVNDFANMMGYMPLRNSTHYIHRGRQK
ncbi:Glyco-transf-64 domain-containing protein [Fusarium falciforme]|uniref:Glyco-transf-64 domain-containing protein n=1 Tax=Fusarium falciforme TaxID=195108 RepID=UPI0023010840|nr:Glyco-transf-64 domain-containing protein [Fusarium falciforme]WAO91787.1 Glyco-transf-64 domain-containing protein [Fusarium falciforme]